MTSNFSSFPTQFDALHLILGATLLVALILLIVAVRRKPATVQTTVDVPEPTTSRSTAPAPAPAPAPEFKAASPDAALQLLALLQQNARLIDFFREDLKGFSDADVGAAARVVHEGGKKTLNEYFRLEPVRSESEESRITLNAGFNAAEVRLTGNVTGQPPFTGTLIHRGWKATEVKLPQLSQGHDVSILAAAEVEL